MRGFWTLHARRVYEHRLRTGLTVTGIAAACGLLVAVLCLSASITGSVARTAEVVGPADLQVTGLTDGGIDDDLLTLVERTPGVAAAAPFVRAPVTLAGRPALLVGVDERAAAVADSPGRADWPAGLARLAAPAGGVVVERRLAHRIGVQPGAPVAIGASGRATEVTVLAVVDGDSLPGGATVLAPLDQARRLAGRGGRVDGVAVVAESGADPIGLEADLRRSLAGRAVVVSSRLLERQASTAAGALRTGLLTVSVIVLLVAAFVVFNTAGIAALERRRELATLRALGARRLPLLTGFVCAAALLGLVGGAIGSAAGVVAARHLVAGLPTLVAAGFGRRATFVLPPTAVPLALLTGTGLAALAALVPGRAAVRVPPVVAMRPEGLLEAAPRKGRSAWPVAAAGLAAAAGGLVLAAGSGRGAVLPAIVMFWGGALVAELALAVPLADVAARLAGRLRAAGRLAAAALAGAPRRAVVTAAAVGAAVALVVAQTGTERNIDAALRTAFGPLAATDIVVTTQQPGDEFSAQPLPAAVVARLAELPGVARTSRGHDVFVTWDADRVRLRGVERGSAIPAWRLAPPGARRRVLAGGAAILTTGLAGRRGVGAGDRVTLPTPSGPRRLLVAAVVETFAWSPGDAVIAIDRLHDWYGRAGPTRVEVNLAAGADAKSVRRAALTLLDDTASPARVITGTEAAEEAGSTVRQVAATFDAIELVVVLAAGLAIFNTMTIAVVQRRRELGLLRAIGTGCRRLRHSVLAEAAAIGTLGALLGLVLGAGGHYLVVLGTQQIGGLPVTYRFEPLPFLVAAAAALVLTLAGSIGPAWRAGRVAMLDAIGYE